MHPMMVILVLTDLKELFQLKEPSLDWLFLLRTLYQTSPIHSHHDVSFWKGFALAACSWDVSPSLGEGWSGPPQTPPQS